MATLEELGPGILLRLCGAANALQGNVVGRIRCWAGPYGYQVGIVQDRSGPSPQCCDDPAMAICNAVMLPQALINTAGPGLQLVNGGPDITASAVPGALAFINVAAADPPAACVAVLRSISPANKAAAPGAFTLKASGWFFNPACKIRVDGADIAGTVFIDAQTLTAQVTFAAAGAHPVVVRCAGVDTPVKTLTIT